MGADRVPAYGTPEYYIYHAVKEQKKQKPAASVSTPVVSWSATPEDYIQQAVKEQKNKKPAASDSKPVVSWSASQEEKPATSDSKPVVSWSDSEVKMPDTSKYFKMAAETFNKNKASYDAMFPTRKPATPSTSSTSSSSEVKKAEEPKEEGKFKLVEFEYTPKQKGDIETELKIIKSELENLEKNAPKLEGDKDKYRKDADAYHAKKAIYQDAQKAFGFMTTIQKGKEESPAELKRILKDYTSHKEALKRYFDLADGEEDGKLTKYNERFGALTSAKVNIIPEKDEYKALEDAFNKPAPSTSVTSIPVSSTPTNSTPDSKGSTGSKDATPATPATSTSAQTPENILEKLEQKEQFNKDIKNFNSRKNALPSLMFDKTKLEEEAKFVENLLKQFGNQNSIQGDKGVTLDKDTVIAYKERINKFKEFAKQEVTNKPEDILKKLEEAGDKDAKKLEFLDTLSDKEVLMLLKDNSQDVVRNFFSKDNIGDDTASYTFLLSRMTMISENFGVDVPSGLNDLKDSKYKGANVDTSMAQEDGRYEKLLRDSVKEGYGGDDKQIVWMKTIDSLTAGFKTKEEIEATKQRTNAQKPKVFEFYVDRIKNVGKNNPAALQIINESEERLAVFKDKEDGMYKIAGAEPIRQQEINDIKHKLNVAMYSVTSEKEANELLSNYWEKNKVGVEFSDDKIADHFSDGHTITLKQAVAFIRYYDKLVNELCDSFGVDEDDALRSIYNTIYDERASLGLENLNEFQEYDSEGDYKDHIFRPLYKELNNKGYIK